LLAYAKLIWGDYQPPLTPTDKTSASDPKVLRHLSQDQPWSVVIIMEAGVQ
jgi:hypothetical protein